MALILNQLYYYLNQQEPYLPILVFPFYYYIYHYAVDVSIPIATALTFTAEL